MKINSIILLFSFCIFTITCQEKTDKRPAAKHDNYLTKTQWLIRNFKVIGTDNSAEEYILYKNKDTSQLWNFSAVDFTDESHFTSYNSWECGNDCFTTTDGTYRFVGESKVELQIDSIRNTGICEEPVKRFSKPKKLLFQIEKSADSVILKKLDLI